MNTVTQLKNVEWLYAKGWTLSEASDAVGVTPHHVRMVLMGQRFSSRLIIKLTSLPKKPLVLRRSKNKLLTAAKK